MTVTTTKAIPVTPGARRGLVVDPSGVDARRGLSNLSLAELQAMFQEAILVGNSDILNYIPDNAHTTADVLLGVYQHAYKARLIEVLAADFPIVETMMGKKRFDEVAKAYIEAYSSNQQNVRWFSRHMPSFLTECQCYKDTLEWSEMAQLEWALNTAFDAPDEAHLRLADLQQLPANAWADLQFTPHVSVSRLVARYNVFSIWTAYQNQSALPKVSLLDEPEQILVWRKDDTARLRIMTSEEAMMFDEASRAVPFARLCELLAVFSEPETAALRAAQYVQGWISTEVLKKQ